jgi:4-amino-4-deoxy-L-arabinose transferase-like glycosyltransferase
MTHPSEPILPAAAEPSAGVAARIGAFIVALCVLIGAAVFSLGTVLFAPLGMAVATYFWRRRGRALTTVGHWLAAVFTVMALLVILAAVGAGFVPKSTWEQFGHTMDSASVVAQRQEVGRGIARPTPADTAKGTRRLPRATSLTVTTVTMSFGAAFVIIVFGAIFGSVGWAAGMLLGFAAKGRWPGAAV